MNQISIIVISMRYNGNKIYQRARTKTIVTHIVVALYLNGYKLGIKWEIRGR